MLRNLKIFICLFAALLAACSKGGYRSEQTDKDTFAYCDVAKTGNVLVSVGHIVADAQKEYLLEKANKRLQAENKSKGFTIMVLSLACAVAVVIIVILLFYIIEKRKVCEYKAGVCDLADEAKVENLSVEEHTDIETTDIYKQIQRAINSPKSKMRLTDEEWDELSKVVNTAYPDFDRKLSDLCKMSLQDYRVCLLLKVGIPLSVIADFASLTKSGVTSLRAKLYKRAFHTVGSAAQWDEAIRSL